MILGVIEGQIRGGYFPDCILDPSVVDPNVESTTLIGENFVFSFEIFIVMFMPLFDKFSNSGRRGTHLDVQACMD